MIVLITLLALAILQTAKPAIASGIPSPVPVKTDALVGVYYFPGWSIVDRWYCIAASDTAQHPLLGYYREGNPDAADWHIKWALEHGINFFSFDFYTSGGSQMLESALDDGFLKAKYIDRFKFCLNWCNHAPYTEMTADEMERFGDLVIKKYLTHPSYLRIDNKPVLMILVGYGFVKNLGVDKAKEVFTRFENRCKDAGLPGVYLVFCEGEIQSVDDIKKGLEAGADAYCRYNYPYAGTDITGPGKHGEATYAHLIDQGEDQWKHWKEHTGGKHWPTVMPGWDRRPWTKDQDLIRTGSTPDLFEESLRRSRNYLNKDRVVMIEAWNEWGEGSVIEPSIEYKFAYLDKVRKVFCPDSGKHTDTDPKSLGLKLPVFDLRLPSVDTWKFDFDQMGWTAVNLSNVTCKWGALICESTSDDPQLTSPITYLDCKDYPSLYVRMRVSRPDGDPEKTAGQLFWSTTETGLSGEASVTFDVNLDGKWHDYKADLKSHKNWKGRTDRLRFDPVTVKGVHIEIDEIRLMPQL